MKNFRIEEAIAVAKSNGKKIRKQDLAKKLWPETEKESAQRVNMANLCNGKIKKINPEWIDIICAETGCSADFLLGRTEI